MRSGRWRCGRGHGGAAGHQTPQLKLLVNSAAVFRYDGADAITPAIFTEAMAVNAATPARMAQAFLAARACLRGQHARHEAGQSQP
jgi:NAD(P)-dependent dehydrogenase (short-subunit alcohol dehydrogenase family)